MSQFLCNSSKAFGDHWENTLQNKIGVYSFWVWQAFSFFFNSKQLFCQYTLKIKKKDQKNRTLQFVLFKILEVYVLLSTGFLEVSG